MSREFMTRAVELALESVAQGGGPFGAVVVKDGRIVGSGTNRVVLDRDPTAHAEVQAIRDACRALGTHDLSGAELFSSCEPCPMCLGAIRWARLAAVHYGSRREDAARIGFDDEVLHTDFRREPGEWELPVRELGREEALAAFRAWEAKEDRRMY